MPELNIDAKTRKGTCVQKLQPGFGKYSIRYTDVRILSLSFKPERVWVASVYDEYLSECVCRPSPTKCRSGVIGTNTTTINDFDCWTTSSTAAAVAVPTAVVHWLAAYGRFDCSGAVTYLSGCSTMWPFWLQWCMNLHLRAASLCSRASVWLPRAVSAPGRDHPRAAGFSSADLASPLLAVNQTCAWAQLYYVVQTSHFWCYYCMWRVYAVL